MTEPVTLRLALCTSAVLGGIALVLAQQRVRGA